MKTFSLAFLATLAVTQTACSLIDNTTTQASNGNSKSTFARYVPERSDDFAWENDVIAFRAYGPALRQGAENAGVDCWLKRVDYPIINKWYRQALQENKSYHQDHGEGLDNYHVGSSAGCGGTALWIDGKRQPLETYTSWNMLESTPEKTSFELHYRHQIDGQVYRETKQISIELGQQLYRVESRFYKNGDVAANLPVAIGVTTHDGKAKVDYDQQQGWLSAWESLGDSELGTGIKLAPDYITDFQLIKSGGVKDKGHAVFIAKTDDNGQLVYHAGYGWKKARHITTEQQWHNYLSAFPVK